MNEDQNEKMRWVLFWIFIGFYVVITSLTLLALFFGLGSLTEGYKKPLFTTFIVETGIGVTTLFYALFALKKAPARTLPQPAAVETEVIHDVGLVTDLPYKGVIDLDKSSKLLESYNENFRTLLSQNNFTSHFKPNMLLFVSPDPNYNSFRPTVVIQIEKNQLPEINMTLADYMDSVFTETQKLQSIIGKRFIRIGVNSATQWYQSKASKIMGIETNLETTYQQVQKIVLSDELMGIITISYSDETSPEDQNVLQQLLAEFGVK